MRKKPRPHWRLIKKKSGYSTVRVVNIRVRPRYDLNEAIAREIEIKKAIKFLEDTNPPKGAFRKRQLEEELKEVRKRYQIIEKNKNKK